MRLAHCPGDTTRIMEAETILELPEGGGCNDQQNTRPRSRAPVGSSREMLKAAGSSGLAAATWELAADFRGLYAD